MTESMVETDDSEISLGMPLEAEINHDFKALKKGKAPSIRKIIPEILKESGECKGSLHL